MWRPHVLLIFLWIGGKGIRPGKALPRSICAFSGWCGAKVQVNMKSTLLPSSMVFLVFNIQVCSNPKPKPIFTLGPLMMIVFKQVYQWVFQCLFKQTVPPQICAIGRARSWHVKPFKQTKQCFESSPMKNQHKLLTCSCLCTLKY